MVKKTILEFLIGNALNELNQAADGHDLGHMLPMVLKGSDAIAMLGDGDINADDWYYYDPNDSDDVLYSLFNNGDRGAQLFLQDAESLSNVLPAMDMAPFYDLAAYKGEDDWPSLDWWRWLSDQYCDNNKLMIDINDDNTLTIDNGNGYRQTFNTDMAGLSSAYDRIKEIDPDTFKD